MVKRRGFGLRRDILAGYQSLPVHLLVIYGCFSVATVTYNIMIMKMLPRLELIACTKLKLNHMHITRRLVLREHCAVSGGGAQIQ